MSVKRTVLACRAAYFPNKFQNAIKRLSRKIRIAIEYAAFSPRVVLTLYVMMEAYIKAHSKTGMSLANGKTDSKKDFHPQIRRCDQGHKWILHHTFCTDVGIPSNTNVRRKLAHFGS